MAFVHNGMILTVLWFYLFIFFYSFTQLSQDPNADFVLFHTGGLVLPGSDRRVTCLFYILPSLRNSLIQVFLIP